MRRVISLLIGILVAALASAAVFGQNSNVTPRSSATFLAETREAIIRNSAKGSVKPENVNAYYMGFDFEAATLFIELDETEKAIEIATYLYPRLVGTPDASRINRAIEMLSNKQPLEAMVMLEMAQLSFESRVKDSEAKWFYSVGKNYGQLIGYFALDMPDQAQGKMVELASLARTAPVGTPVGILNPLSRLGEYGRKQSITKEDVAGITAEIQKLNNAVIA